MPEPSILDERLAEIDRRLRVIQSGLVPLTSEERGEPSDAEAGDSHGAVDQVEAERPPRPTLLRAAPPAPEPDSDWAPAPGPPAPFDAVDRLGELAEGHERLLELHRELLSQYAEVLGRRAGESETLAVAAGPFSAAAAVRDFERALATLPGVSDVVVREYPGGDRVVLDVRLSAH